MNNLKQQATGRKIKKNLLIVLIAIISSSCTTTSTPTNICPPVVDYSDQYKIKIVDAIFDLPENSVLVQVLTDYIVMRDQAKACAGEE